MKHILLALTLGLILTGSSAAAGEAEVSAAQSTIESQLQAFLADDDATAYSFAAPNIKRLFPTQDAFMNMVRQGYPQVHRPRNYAFGKVEETGGGITQHVLIRGPDGKDYEAVYTLELQGDGIWRITSVSLREATTLGV